MELSFPARLTTINDKMSVWRKEDSVYYYMQKNLIFVHKSNDKIAFQFIICQLFLTRLAKQTEIIRTFKVSKSTIIRWIKKYRKEGTRGFLKITKRVKSDSLPKKRTKRRKRKEISNILGEESSIKKNGIKKLYL